MTDWDCNPRDAQEYYSKKEEPVVDPYEKKAFIGNKDCLIKKDNAGYKYIAWREDGLGHAEIVLYDYELEEMLNRLKQYKGE